MKNSEWFEIRDHEVNKPHDQNFRGVKVTVKLSPFDIPKLASSEIDEQTGIVKILFDYSGNSEELRRIDETQHNLKLLVGKKTKRLYKIEIDCSSFINQDADFQVNLCLEQAEDAFSSESILPGLIRPQSILAAKNILHEYKDSFIHALNQQHTAHLS